MPVMNREIVMQRLKQVKPELEKKYLLTELALFGSYARHEQQIDSDIDVMVRFAKPSYRSLWNTTYILKDLFPGTRIQVVSKGGIKPKYFERIKDDLIYA